MPVEYKNPNPNNRAFSHSVKVDNVVYTHGQLGVSTRESSESFLEQADRALDLLLEELALYGLELKDVFKTTIYLTNKVNLINEYMVWYDKRFKGTHPLRTTLVVEAFSPNPNACIKIELLAYAK